MTAVEWCISCQHGDHSGHVEVVVAAPPGLLGGVICPCKGECELFHDEDEVVVLEGEAAERAKEILDRRDAQRREPND